jgi:outer membrane receptor protein involved in Fe transport
MHFNNQTGTVGNTIENVGNSLHNGMELYTEVDVIGAYDWFRKTHLGDKMGSLAPFVTLTTLHAEFDEGPNEGKHTAFSPQYNFRFGTNYTWRDRIKVSLLSTFMGDHYADDAETPNRHIPSYKVWDLSAEAKLLKDTFRMLDVSIFGGVNNLFDEEYYARITSAGIDPAYPRNVFGGVKVSLGTPSNLRFLKKDSPNAGRIVQGY